MHSMRPPWKPWGSPKESTTGGKSRSISLGRSLPAGMRKGKRVTFHHSDPYRDGSHLLTFLPPEQTSEFDERAKKRNMHTSERLLQHFRSKTKMNLPTFYTEKVPMSETKSSFKVPGSIDPKFQSSSTKRVRTIPIRHSGYQPSTSVPYQDSDKSYSSAYARVAVAKRKSNGKVNLDAHTLDKITKMRRKVMSGEYVSMTDITNVRNYIDSKDILPIEMQDKHLNRPYTENRTYRFKRSGVVRQPLFCEKGILKVPTPHKPKEHVNDFGSPADLRISLSNADTPEFEGRRRFFFDLTGFEDKEINLYLEGSRRLVIQGERPTRDDKPAVQITEFIDLPPDLPVDNLRIVRDLFGTLIIEEAWKFT